MSLIRRSGELKPASRLAETMHLRSYERFCRPRGKPWPATMKMIQEFLDRRSGKVTFTTLRLTMNAIRRRHLDQGWDDPLESALLTTYYRGVMRRCRQRELRILRPQDVAYILDRMPSTGTGIRDSVLILLILCGRFSHRSLSGLNRSDVSFYSEGMHIRARFASSMQTIAIRNYAADSRYCVVAAMQRYLRLIDDDDPILFRQTNPHGVLLELRLNPRGITKALLRRAIPPGSDKPVGTWSLVASAIVTATNRGAGDYAIMRQFGYSTVDRVRTWQDQYAPATRDLTQRLGL